MNRQAAWTWIATLVVGAWICEPASAQTQNPAGTPKAGAAAPLTPAQKAAADARRAEAERKAAQAMIPILAEWEKRSAQITSLDAVFDKVEISPGFGNQWYRGRAMLQSPDKACLEFKLYKLDDKHNPIIEVDPKDGKRKLGWKKSPKNGSSAPGRKSSNTCGKTRPSRSIRSTRRCRSRPFKKARFLSSSI